MRTLSKAEIEALGAELDAIRRDVEDSRGAQDATYIRRTIALQRTLEAGARLVIDASRTKLDGSSGTAALAVAKASRTWKSATMSATASGTG